MGDDIGAASCWVQQQMVQLLAGYSSKWKRVQGGWELQNKVNMRKPCFKSILKGLAACCSMIKANVRYRSSRHTVCCTEFHPWEGRICVMPN
jgi:hypothetical protein